jgi:hypothetical protein
MAALANHMAALHGIANWREPFSATVVSQITCLFFAPLLICVDGLRL